MKSSIRTVGLVTVLGIVLLAMFVRPASASTTNLGHANFLEWQTGQLDANDPSDGYWTFISGRGSTLRVNAISTNGNNIGMMQVYSHKLRRWIQPATYNSQTHSLVTQVGSGWHYVLLKNFGGSTTTYRLGISVSDATSFPDAGDSFSTATQLGTIGLNWRIWHDEVGLGDTTDIFRVELPQGSNFFSIIAGDTYSGGATVQLLDVFQRPIETRTVNGTNTPLIQRTLPGGSYFIRIQQAGGSVKTAAGTRYALLLRNEQTQPDYAGDLNNPRYMGGVQVGRTLFADDFVVARIDQVDAYSFDVLPINGANTQQYINIAIRGNTGNANLYLLDAKKNIIANSTSAGSNETIKRYLRPGRYHLMVLSTGTVGIPYRLTILNQGLPYTPPPVVTDKGSNFRQTASILGLVNAQGLRISDNIGGTDVADWWRVTVPGPNVFTRNAIVGFVMQVSNLPAGATVQMYSPTSSSPTVSVPAVGGVAQFTTSLSPGVWDVVVFVPAGSAATTYTLRTCSFSTYLGCTLP